MLFQSSHIGRLASEIMSDDSVLVLADKLEEKQYDFLACVLRSESLRQHVIDALYHLAQGYSVRLVEAEAYKIFLNRFSAAELADRTGCRHPRFGRRVMAIGESDGESED